MPLERTVGFPWSWCPQTKTSCTWYPQECNSVQSPSKSVWGSVGSIDLGTFSQEITDKLLQARHSWGLNCIGFQNVSVWSAPMIPASSLWKELWSGACPGVCHFPIILFSNYMPLIIHATAPVSSFKEPLLMAKLWPIKSASCICHWVPINFISSVQCSAKIVFLSYRHGSISWEIFSKGLLPISHNWWPCWEIVAFSSSVAVGGVSLWLVPWNFSCCVCCRRPPWQCHWLLSVSQRKLVAQW